MNITNIVVVCFGSGLFENCLFFQQPLRHIPPELNQLLTFLGCPIKVCPMHNTME